MLLQCDGPCMRSFHCGGLLERDDEGRPGRFLWQPEGSSDACNPLRLDQELAHAIITSPDPFQCPNCLANRHVCFACGKLGVAGKDVFPCIAASCGKFYHRKCASNGKGAAAGEEGPLLCGLHSCGACGAQGDSPDDDKGELVPCRRCPVAFHRACIPQRLYEDDQDRVWLYEADEEGNPLPGVTVGRSLLYCAKHALEPSGVAKQRTSFTDDLWRAWRRHCAQQYPHLATSKQWLLPAASAAAAAAAAVGKKRPASAAGRAAAKAEARPSGEVGGQDARAAAGSAAARAVAEAAFAAARAAVFKEDVRRNTRQPVPYDTCMRKTVDEVGPVGLACAPRSAHAVFCRRRPSRAHLLDPGALRLPPPPRSACWPRRRPPWRTPPPPPCRPPATTRACGRWWTAARWCRCCTTTTPWPPCWRPTCTATATPPTAATSRPRGCWAPPRRGWCSTCAAATWWWTSAAAPTSLCPSSSAPRRARGWWWAGARTTSSWPRTWRTLCWPRGLTCGRAQVCGGWGGGGGVGGGEEGLECRGGRCMTRWGELVV
jgi:hypothetical protein